VNSKARKWVKGLIGAAIGGAANSVSAMIIDPTAFNLGDLRKLAAFALVSGAISAALYLKQSPVPPDSDEDRIEPRIWKDEAK
jgi:hypothetical protein